mmetsp:Transcript_56623/g.184175  ORF Transcript_56623/g.184175 Transcript_56623/m.184175 type:complete len:336 (+) Transcript_56623:150-1157(+)
MASSPTCKVPSVCRTPTRACSCDDTSHPGCASRSRTGRRPSSNMSDRTFAYRMGCENLMRDRTSAGSSRSKALTKNLKRSLMNLVPKESMWQHKDACPVTSQRVVRGYGKWHPQDVMYSTCKDNARHFGERLLLPTPGPWSDVTTNVPLNTSLAMSMTSRRGAKTELLARPEIATNKCCCHHQPSAKEYQYYLVQEQYQHQPPHRSSQAEDVPEPQGVDLILTMGHMNDGNVGVIGENLKHLQQARPIRPRETVCWLVKQQQARAFHQRAAQQHQLLLAERKMREVLGVPLLCAHAPLYWRCDEILEPKPLNPRTSNVLMRGANFLIQADGIEKP